MKDQFGIEYPEFKEVSLHGTVHQQLKRVQFLDEIAQSFRYKDAQKYLILANISNQMKAQLKEYLEDENA